jgi:putative oxidoreductase
MSRRNERKRQMTDTRATDYGAFLLRVSMGVMLLAHGLLLKVMTFGFAGTAGFFASIGYPPALAYVVIIAEVVGGAMLILGVYSRYVALALVPIMIGATIQHLPNGWLFGAPNGGWEFPAFWTVTLVVQALIGDGAFAMKPAALPALDRTQTARA